MKKCLVIGYGISGKAAAAFLRMLGYEVIAVDKKGGEGIEIDRPDFPLDGIDQVILSPGVLPSHPIVVRAKERGIEVIGEIELAFRNMKNRCVGITGSNGKTTTTLLTAHLLKEAGIPARALGNVGDPLSGYLLSPDEKEILVVELSSFQLETLEVRGLDAAAILNITPNHLDRHASMEEYAAAKMKIRKCLKEGGPLFVSKRVKKEYQLENCVVFDEESIALNSSEQYIKLGGPEPENVAAAFAICAFFGSLDWEKGLKTFRKPPHRMEWIADIRGVAYFNDSKSSNIDSVMHGVGMVNGPIHLLVGGVHKGSSYQPWIEKFQGKVKKIYAFGQAASKMEEELASFFSFCRVSTMQEALAIARNEAKENETILLSPGCSSYDQFRNFEHRGEEFKRMVKEFS